MRKINSRQSTKLKIYNQKTNLSSLIWLLSGIGVLGFGIYFLEIFEIIGGIILIIVSIFQFITRLKNKNPFIIVKRERGKLKYICIAILVFSLINPIGIVGCIYDLFKRDWVLSGGLDE